METYNILTFEDLPNEIWRNIEGYEGYLVSNLGRIKSAQRKVPNKNHLMTIKGIIKKQRLDHNGYPVVCLCIRKKFKNKIVHRLVAKAFIDNPENKPYVNHKNGIQIDNRIENLEWVTNSENLLHAYRVLGIKLPPSKMKKDVYQFDKTGKLIKKWDSQTEAALFFKIKPCGISNAVRKNNMAAGFFWSHTNFISKEIIKNHKNHFNLIELNGKLVSHSEAERILGFSHGIIYSRLNNGWSIEKTLNTNVRKLKK